MSTTPIIGIEHQLNSINQRLDRLENNQKDIMDTLKSIQQILSDNNKDGSVENNVANSSPFPVRRQIGRKSTGGRAPLVDTSDPPRRTIITARKSTGGKAPQP